MKPKLPVQGIVGRAALREAAAATPDLRAVMDMVRAAINDKINTPLSPDKRQWISIEAFYADRMIVEAEDGRCWSYPYTLTGTAVTLGDATEVVETYAPIKEAAATALVEAAGQPEGVAWDATLIQSGLSTGSKVFYTDAVLREAAPLFEGARIFIKGDKQHIAGEGKDVRQLVGWVAAPRFVEGATPDTGRLVGTVHLPGLPDTTRALFVEAAKAGKSDLVGLSIDAEGKTKKQLREGKPVRVASALTRVNSVDLIVEPGAGGGLVRMVEAAATPQEIDDMGLRERMLEAIRAKDAAKAAQIDLATINDAELEAAYREAVALPVPSTSSGQATSTLRQAQDRPSSGQAGGLDVEERIRMMEARASMREALAAAALPQAAKDRLLADFSARPAFAAADVATAIQGEREYLAKFAESGRVRMAGLDIQVEDRSRKIGDMLDAFFDPEHKEHRSARSFRECYREITGDARVTGRVEDCDPARLREAAGDSVLRESATSATFANVLGNSMTRRLLADYNMQDGYDVWKYLAGTPVPLNDFRTQERTRYGGYGDLPIVAESAAYTAQTTPTDEKATYAAQKRGGTEDITLEMIKNDDVGIIRQLPVKLSRAAKRTLSKFVLDFLRSNPNIYDGTAWFTAAHGNLGAAALDAAQVSAARLAILKQTEAGSTDRMGIPPKYLWVPYDLQQAATDIFSRNTNLDKTFVQNLNLNVVPVWYWTDGNDWCVTVDPADMPLVEIGFLDGQEEPELFVQDMPNVGSMFSNDKLTYKIRHIYGGNVMNYRGAFKAIVL